MSQTPLRIRYVSFDLDGTLVDEAFADAVWLEAIPRLYARRWGVDPSEARDVVLGYYDGVGDGALEWYDIAYWFRRFDLGGKWQDLLEQHSHLIRVYPEVHEVLDQLGRQFPLVIVSNAAREFVEVEMKRGKLNGYFQRTISATSDFRSVKNTHDFYVQVCEILGTAPGEIVHVGDHWQFDYEVPRGMGIRAYVVDRRGERNGPDAIKDLASLEAILGDSG
jgi:putative hydrolase of the HAD superfamily